MNPSGPGAEAFFRDLITLETSDKVTGEFKVSNCEGAGVGIGIEANQEFISAEGSV